MFTIVTTGTKSFRKTKVRSWLEVAQLTFKLFDCDWYVMNRKAIVVAHYEHRTGKFSCSPQLDRAYNKL